MNAIWLRIRAWTRTSRATIVWSALLIGVVAGVVMGLATGVRRTASAPDRYTERVGGDYDLLLYQPFGPPLAAAIRGIDGVRSVESITFVAAFPVLPDGVLVFEANPFAGDPEFGGARIAEGRFPQPGAADEFTVNADLAELLDVDLGTIFPIRSYSPQQIEQNAFADGTPPSGASLQATLVGITQVPSDYSNSAPTIFFSPDLLEQYGDDIGAVATIIGVRLGPDAAPDAVLEEIYALPGGSEVFNQPPEIVPVEARRGVGVQVAALWIVVAVAAAAAAIVVLQIARRIIGSTASERSVLNALGWTSRDVASEAAAKAAIVTAVSAPLAVAVAATLSARFPIGAQRLFEPDSGTRLDTLVLLAGFAVTLSLVAIGGLARGRLRVPAPGGRGGFSALAQLVGAGMPLTVGASLASDGSTSSRGGFRSFSIAVATVAVIVGSGTVAIALRDIDRNPSRWGANYQYRFGNPFVPATDDFVTPLSNSPDVEALTAATTDSITILGQDFPVFAFDIVRGDIGPAVLSGRLPRNPDEIGLGAETMRTLDVQIGDEVTVLGDDGSEVALRVVGRTTSADTAGAGASMTFAGLTALRPAATKNLMLVDLRDDAASGTVERFSEITYSPPDALVVPTSVQGLRRAAPAPFILLVVLVTLAVAALAYRMVMSLRLRRNDLIVLRALGAEGKQLRRAVHWHVTLLGAGAMLIGIPAGLVAARWVVLSLASTVGILPAAPIPLLGLLAGVVVGVVSANLIAAIPARRAAKVRTDLALRDVAAR